ncbi:MAG: hydrolase [Methyloprofundus sp.]|nr:hydrolase [Methyloprofundus sp.]MBW6453084.1 hydrolase [Methyloprofundus sp.]
MTTHPNLLDSHNSLLLIVDIQDKLTTVMPEGNAQDMLENSARLIAAANLLNLPIIITEQYPKGLGLTVDSIREKLSDKTPRFEKTGFSCLAAENFQDTLEKTTRKQIIIVGQETHVCILQTALELMQQGYQVHIVEDAVCSRKAENKFYALQRLQSQGASISNFESVLFEWLKNSQHEHFSAISALLR